jgi:hypothetical protein
MQKIILERYNDNGDVEYRSEVLVVSEATSHEMLDACMTVMFGGGYPMTLIENTIIEKAHEIQPCNTCDCK